VLIASLCSPIESYAITPLSLFSIIFDPLSRGKIFGSTSIVYKGVLSLTKIIGEDIFPLCFDVQAIETNISKKKIFLSRVIKNFIIYYLIQ
jgi:hypothetical protein